jgi:hypothetical protein
MAAVLIGLLAKNVMYLPGVCQQQPSVTIIDETKGMNTGLNYSNDPRFKHYVATISQHFATKINQLGKCHYVELFFVYRPLISAGIKPFDFDLAKSFDTRSLDSPWVKMTFANSYKPIARAAFIWNERQFILDQALLSGASADTVTALLPIDAKVFNRFLGEYKDAKESALHEFTVASKVRNNGGEYPNILANKTRQLRLPADLLWLFSHSGGFDWNLDTWEAKNRTIEQKIEQYIELTKVLISNSFTSVHAERVYRNIFDVKDIFNIDKYQIK